MFVISYYRIMLLDFSVFIYEKNYKLRSENLGKLTLFLGFLLRVVLKKKSLRTVTTTEIMKY